jgi:hypothetical protein
MWNGRLAYKVVEPAKTLSVSFSSFSANSFTLLACSGDVLPFAPPGVQ